MKIRTIAVLALALAGSGCVTAAEQRAADETRCSSYGFRRGTDAYSRCLLDLDLDRSAVALPVRHRLRAALVRLSLRLQVLVGVSRPAQFMD